MHLAGFLLLLLAGRLVLSQGQLNPKHCGQGHAHRPHQAPGTGEGFSSLKVTPGITTFALGFHHLMASQARQGQYLLLPSERLCRLAMLSLEVSSHSRTQILEGLGFNLMQVSEFNSHQGFQNLLHTLYLPGNRLEVCMGNALFLSPEQLLLLRYLKDSAIFYESRLFSTNFKDSVSTTQLINHYLREETRGKIVNLVSKLNADTMMMLVNYVYFKGNLFCLVLWTDYQGNIITLFFLPNRGKMEQVEEVLTLKMLTRWSNLLQKNYLYRKLKLYLPKFSISGSYNLDQILPKLGITDLFFQQVDLSGITEQLNLQVSKSFRKAVLEVGEVGTQTAVVTGSSVTFWARDNRQALWLNRLFLVVIFFANAQSILFLGKVVNPMKS